MTSSIHAKLLSVSIIWPADLDQSTSSLHICSARIRNVYYKSETTLPYKANLDPENEYLVGGYDGNIATENGLQFNIDWLRGQKTGFFVDQRENRPLIVPRNFS